MDEMTGIVAVLVDCVVNCGYDPAEALPDSFFRALLMLDKLSPTDKRLRTFVLDEISRLRSRGGYSEVLDLSAEQYRTDLVRRIHLLQFQLGAPIRAQTEPQSAETFEQERAAGAQPFAKLCESIATTVQDYRLDELGPMVPEHVERWVYQFDESDRLTILQELDRILPQCYISKSKTTDLIRRMLTSTRIFGERPADALSTSTFLSIQRHGKSQHDLLALTDQMMLSEYGQHLPQPATPNRYIYLDDCLFSGATAFYDIKQWLPQAPSGAHLCLILWAAHSEGLRYYIEGLLRPLLADKHISLHGYIEVRVFKNSKYWPDDYDCLWPEEPANDPQVDSYVASVKERADWTPHLFRPHNDTLSYATLFSSPQARHTVEQAFLKAGAKIVALSENPKVEMRPMGYEKLESLGFGAMFTTYRNIPNNCPLALWWGDPSYSKRHPLGNWLPLFKRKQNDTNSTEPSHRPDRSSDGPDESDWSSGDEVPS